MQRWQSRIGRELRSARTHRDSGVQAIVLMRGGMVVAKREQRPDFEHTVRGASAQFVLHNRRVLALHHEDALLDLDAVHLVEEHRKWIETKLLEVSIPL